MADQGDATNCAVMSWALAALGGAVIGVVLFVAVGWTFAPAAVLAVVLAAVVGVFLTLFVCPARQGPAGHKAPTASTSAPQTAASTMAAPTGAQARDDVAAENVASETAMTETPVSDPLVTPKSDAPTADRMQDGAATPAAEDAPVEEPAAAETSAEVASAPEPTVEPIPQNKVDPAQQAETDGPELLDSPRAGGADDLKKIGGIGPKLEQTLNEMGIWHYSQIASWGSDDIEWVDARVSFKGRIERDDWVGQAEALEQARN